MAYNTNTEPRIYQNTFRKGMNLDSIESAMPEGYWREAWNTVIGTEQSSHFGVSSEASNELFAALPSGYNIRGIHFVEERDHMYFFLNLSGKSEIGYVDLKTKEYVTVYNDCQEVLDFGTDTWIPNVSKVMQPCNELHLYWAVRDYYFRLNVDDTSEIENCDDLYLFQPNCIGVTKVETTEKGGSDLQGGAYDVVAQLEDEDGNVTNWFNFGNTVYLGTENNTTDEISEGALHITIRNLGKDYVKVNLGVFHNGNSVGRVIASLPYSSNGIEYFYSSRSQYVRDVPITEVLGRNNGYPRGEDLHQHDGKLFLFNLRGERNLDYQERALQIKPSYVIGRVPIKYAHMFKGLRGGEVYAVSMHCNYSDGTRSRSFHIGNVDTTGSASGEDCEGCGGNGAGNNATATPITQDVFEVSDGVRNGFSRTSPETNYELFTPTDQELYDFDDADYPDVTDVPDPNSAGDGDGCECEVICQAYPGTGGWGVFPRILPGGGLFGGGLEANPTYYQEILARMEIAKKKCDCDCLGGGFGAPLAEGGDSPEAGLRAEGLLGEEEVTFNADDVTKLFTQLTLEANAENGTLTEQDVQDYLALTYTYDETGPSIEVQLRGASSDDPTGGGGDDEVENGTLGESDCYDGESPTIGTGDCEYDTSTGGDSSHMGNNSQEVSHGGVYEESDNGSGSSTTTEATGSSSVNINNDCEPEVIIKEGTCCEVEKVIPCIDAMGELSAWESCETYPTSKRCDSEEFIYGEYAGKPIRHLKMPNRAIQPHFVSYNRGVPNASEADADEYKNTYARFIWLKLDNIQMPKEEELDKPLCSKNPITISIVKRDSANKSVIASGLARYTFKGDSYGRTQLYPKHGLNSDVYISRYIENTSGTLRRQGEENTDTSAYTFLSPDTSFDRPNIAVDRFNFNLLLDGEGYRHGLYGEGEDPETFFASPAHSKGARQSLYLSQYVIENQQRCYKAASYAPADSVVDRGDNFSYNLVNLGRESSVYFETEGSPFNTTDSSFDRDVNRHSKFIEGKGHYVDFVRDVPNQYGRLENLSYIPIYQASGDEIKDGSLVVKGGDSFIGLHSVKTTSYVSDRVQVSPKSKSLAIRNEYSGGIASLPFIGGLIRSILNSVGAQECGTIPEQGPAAASVDPRADNSLNGDDESHDSYFPQLQKTLITFPVESDVNLEFRGGGESKGVAHYRDLNGMEVDSSFGGGQGSYKDSFLDEYWATMTEMPTGKRLVRVLLNLIWTYGIGLYFLIDGWISLTDNLENTNVGLTNTVGSPFAITLSVLYTALGIAWIIIWANTNLDNRFWDKILRIKACYPDKRLGEGKGAMEDDRVVWEHRPGLKDEFYKYEYVSYSRINNFDFNLGLPFNYNTCDCLADKTYQILHSDKQDPTSWRDAYRNFRVNNYVEIPNERGRMTKMFNRSNHLFLQTTDMLWSLQTGTDSLETRNGSEAYLGTGSGLRQPKPLFNGPSEGMAGNLDPNASINTRWGFIWIDREARKVYMYANGLDELGSATMRNFFRENLDFKFLDYFPNYDLADEKVEGGIGYSLGVDYRHDRLLITKHDYAPKKGVDVGELINSNSCYINGQEVSIGDSDYFDNYSWTLSYSFALKNFVSFHSYMPKVYMWDRFDMFTPSSEGMYIHNVNGSFRRFYGKQEPWVINFTAMDNESAETIEFQDTTVYAESRVWDGETYIQSEKIPFDKAVIYNTNQSTGVLDITQIDDNDALSGSYETLGGDELRWDYLPNHSWRFNEVWNRVKDEGVRLFKPFRGNYYKAVNFDNIGEYNGDDKFLDIYIGYILYYDGESHKNILLKRVNTSSHTETL